MHTKDELIKLYEKDRGEYLWKYVQNKHAGGRNNGKGSIFENFVAIYKLAYLMQVKADPELTFISSQVKAFIDDLVIEKMAEKLTEYYQIKDVANLRWNNGDHHLSDDVDVQYALCAQLGHKAHLEIVVSLADVQQQLKNNLPVNIQRKVTVTHFEGANSINNLIRTNSEFRKALEGICALKNPSIDKLDLIGSLLLGAWAGVVPDRVPLKQYIDRCVSINPNFFKGGNAQLSDKLSGILNGDPGL
ncbi:hypothetical protein [Paraflavitalea speifideaquila]|uniref:hypothetical protein n=1 Tax=Paraflavitalea speifideaquila TaxID=3076558 RepID=UPI0028EB0AF7|nr:hypothetical protein [Paraflavitalea speifideiaquila]